MIKSIEWTGQNLKIIDQTKLPENLSYRNLAGIEAVYESIQNLRVRGAPAIGVAAAFGLYLGLRDRKFSGKADFLKSAQNYSQYLKKARPTAVNLEWALNKILGHVINLESETSQLLEAVLRQAEIVLEDDRIRCERIGQNGASLIVDGMNILTHCNTGVLATAGIGTALGIIYTAYQQRKKVTVMVDETRPLLQGARLTMWELQQAGIPAKLITDNMAAYAMQKRSVDMVIVGADRIAGNGDVANKIGTYSLAINCRYHNLPFYVAAPKSTFDLSIKSGDQITIEERHPDEVRKIWNKLGITVDNASCWNPSFDITPANLIDGIITEAGMLKYPFEESISKLNYGNVNKHKELIQ